MNFGRLFFYVAMCKLQRKVLCGVYALNFLIFFAFNIDFSRENSYGTELRMFLLILQPIHDVGTWLWSGAINQFHEFLDAFTTGLYNLAMEKSLFT